jgi:hypothetical protein
MGRKPYFSRRNSYLPLYLSCKFYISGFAGGTDMDASINIPWNLFVLTVGIIYSTRTTGFTATQSFLSVSVLISSKLP